MYLSISEAALFTDRMSYRRLANAVKALENWTQNRRKAFCERCKL